MAVTFPNIKPTARSFDPGDFPQKTYKSQNGTEVRILYGSKRTNMRLSLTYENITDVNAEAFIAHYNDRQGTFKTFSPNSAVFTGWGGQGPDKNKGRAADNNKWLLATYAGNAYRYEKPPELVQVRKGISTVTISLIGVL